MNFILYSSLLLILLVGIISSRPLMQRLIINNHVWEVPDAPGWEEVVKEAELVRQYLHRCKTASECRQVINAMRAVFYSHSASRKYLEAITDGDNDRLDTIFKWG